MTAVARAKTFDPSRRWQEPVAPLESIPPAIRSRLNRTGFNMAEKFRREEVFHAYRPSIALALAQDHLAVAGDERTSYHVHDPMSAARTRCANSWDDAFRHTFSQHRQLQKAHLTRAFDEQEIRDYAEQYSGTCSRLKTFADRCDYVLSKGAEVPEGKNVTEASATARMCDPLWWRRQLRRTWTRRAENVMRELGLVRKGRQPYASDDAVHHRHGQRVRGAAFLESHVVENEAGKQINLLDVVKGSVSNPALRRAEFMTRVRGFEEVAEEAGHEAQFWTLTAPSIYHAQIAAAGKNPKYDGSTAREAQAWLCKQWSRVRAKLKRLSILMYGFRIAEPHHDGTPHWHLLMFCRARDAETIAKVIRDYWLKEHADELGPRDPATGRRPRETARAKLITIDRRVGTAAGYVAKYVSKNIDGEGEIGAAEDWETGRAVNDGIRRVDAWASLHGIRQFQQIGGPPVGLWRELRRLTEASEDTNIERARSAADAGDWRAFVYGVAFEGIRATRRNLCVRLARKDTGELSKYVEEKPAPVFGVRSGSAIEVTRKHQWTIKTADSSKPNPETLSKCGTECSMSESQPGGNGSSGVLSTPSLNSWLSPASLLTLHSLHGGLAGLNLGDAQARADEDALRRLLGLKPKRKGRGRDARPERTAMGTARPAPVLPFPIFSPPWTRGNNCTVPTPAESKRNPPPTGPTSKGDP